MMLCNGDVKGKKRKVGVEYEEKGIASKQEEPEPHPYVV